jgi:hypothetical protein
LVRLHYRTLWERLLVPAFVFFFFKLYPPRHVADPARRGRGGRWKGRFQAAPAR